MFSFLLILVFLDYASLSYQAPLLKSFINGPVIATNFPDPSVIQVDGIWYAFATRIRGGTNVPWAISPDFETWTVQPSDAMPTVGAWSNGVDIWAPDVVRLDDGSFVLYYTARALANSSSHCLGVATSPNVTGPYTARPESFACPIDQGGAIDPSGFADVDGKQYVVYKIDGNNIGYGGSCNNGIAPYIDTPILLQEVSPADGFTPIGSSTRILNRSDADGPLVEAPALLRVHDHGSRGGWMYLLFFSSGCFAEGDYDIKYAVSRNGVANGRADYAKAASPLLVTGSDGGRLYSPGGMDVDVDGTSVVFHADLGNTSQTRQMYVGKIAVDVGTGVVSI